MSKKKEDGVTKSFNDEINSEFGNNIIIGPESITSKEKIRFPTTPKLDLITKGLQPSIALISGFPKVGKSCLALDIIRNILQKREWDELYPRKAYYIDAEHRLSKRHLESTQGLDLTDGRFNVVRSSRGSILSGEKILEVSERILSEVQGAVLVLDSVSSLASQNILSSELGEQVRDPMSLVLSKWTKRIAPIVAINDNVVILLLHVVSNTSGHGAATTQVTGGKKIVFASDWSLRFNYTEKIMSGDEQTGQLCHVSSEWSNLGRAGKTALTLKFGFGYDYYVETAEICCDIGLIKKASSWFSIGSQKFQGMENLRQYLVENPEEFKALDKEMRTMLDMPL